MNNLTKVHKSEQGAALFLTLAVMLILTIMGITSVQTTIMQQRMAGNYRDLSIAFQAAEAAATEAEAFIDAMSNLNAFPSESATQLCSAGRCTSLDGTARWQESSLWSSATGTVKASIAPDDLGVAAAPRYLIEYIAEFTRPDATQVYIFRVTARGTGGTARSVAMLQTTYEKQFGGVSAGRLSWRRL
ncbi:MAG: pilus assembly PilX family protein [Pseudomonadales bacterium]